jgi:hypothetical protein
MHSRYVAGVAAALLVALPIAGCGDDKSSRDAAPKKAPTATADPADTVHARSAARGAAAAVETCFVEQMDYSHCKSAKVLSDFGLKRGSGPGQVEVTEANATTYTLEAHSQAGGVFTIERTGRSSGAITRTCNGPGCEGGVW